MSGGDAEAFHPQRGGLSLAFIAPILRSYLYKGGYIQIEFSEHEDCSLLVSVNCEASRLSSRRDGGKKSLRWPAEARDGASHLGARLVPGCWSGGF